MSVHSFNEREQRVMALASQYIDTDPKINYVKLAPLIGVSSGKLANQAWSRIRTKLNSVLSTNSCMPAPLTSSANARESPAKKTRRVKQPVESADDNQIEYVKFELDGKITPVDSANTGKSISPVASFKSESPIKRKRRHVSDDDVSEDDQDNHMNDASRTRGVPETPSPVRFQAPSQAKSNRPIFIEEETTDSENGQEGYDTAIFDQKAGSETEGTELSS